MTSYIRRAAQHRLNPLHCYCRLRELRIPKGIAKFICSCWSILYRHAPFRDRTAKPGNQTP